MPVTVVGMADLEFFFDPVCPFCWITSRWVKEVQAQRHYEVTWRFISLQFVNEDRTSDWYTEEYRAGHRAGTNALRVAAALRAERGNDAVDAFYTALGTLVHSGDRQKEFWSENEALVAEALAPAGLPATFAAAREDLSHDVLLRAETALAFERTGKDVGTPIITFHPGLPDEASFFGPVISRIPRGEQAVALWDAVEFIATTSGLAELKRSTREPLDFS